MIAQDQIDQAKAVPLEGLMKSKGLQMERRGHQIFARCPFHEDNEPSLAIDARTNLFKCFGCGEAGDPIRFIELFEKKSFPEAVAALASAALDSPPKASARRKTRRPQSDHSYPAPSVASPEDPAKASTINTLELLNRITELYHASLLKAEAPQKYLANRGLTSPDLYRHFKIGYADGSLLKVLPKEGPLLQALEHIGILHGFPKTHNEDGGSTPKAL
jgi:DNA primase